MLAQLRFHPCATQRISPATKKKRAPRPTSDAAANGSSGMAKVPAAMVNTLYGMGENPAMNTASTPHWPNQATACSYAGQWLEARSHGSSPAKASQPIR